MPDVDKLVLEIQTNTKAAVSGIDALAASLGKIKSATKGDLGLGSVSKKLNSLTTSGKSAVNTFAKLTMSFHTLKKAGKVIMGFIDKSLEYSESMNMFTVAMGKFADEAKDYAETVGEIMGIDPAEWMTNQSIIMTLATGFGVASDRAYIMSKNLTQLAYDLTSFAGEAEGFTLQEAMQKIQSGLAGELEPLRRVGYDLSVARLQQEAYTLGIKKKVSQMTQAETAELRYYAIMTQVTTAQGDMARTLETPANQLRVFKAQVTQAGRALGNIFIPLLTKVLPIVIAVTKVFRILADIIAGLFGYELPEIDYSSVNSLADGADNASTALDDAAENAKKLKKYTMGFDELNVIDPTSGSKDSNNNAGMGSSLGFELPEYDFLGEANNSKVAEIVEKMKEWLGITEDITSWSDFFNTRLGKILRLVGLISAGMLLWKVSNSTLAAIATLKGLLANPVYAITISAILTIVGVTMAVDGIKDAIKNGLNKFNFGEILGGSILTVAGASIFGSMFVTWFGKVCSTKMVFALARLGAKLGVETTGMLGAVLAGATASITAGIAMLFVGIWDACKNGIDWLSGLLIASGATLAGAGIGMLIGSVGGPLGALIGLAVGLIVDLGILIYQKWDEIKSLLGKIAEWFNNNIVQPILGFLSPITNWFNENVIQPIIAFFTPVFDTVVGIVGAIYTQVSEIIAGIIDALGAIISKMIEIFKKEVEILVALGKAFKTYIIDPFVEWASGVAKVIKTKVVEPIKEFFVSAGSWFFDNIISPIWEKVMWLREKVYDIFKKVGIAVVDFIGGLLKSVLNGIFALIESSINFFITMLNGAITMINKIPGVNITRVELLSIPRMAEGGFPETGQMFIAREAGPEMVGSIGRRSAVANNDQIVAGIASGVANANTESNTLLREQNTLLRALLEKESGVYLDGKTITKSVEKHQRERGRVLVMGGAY